MQSSQSTTFYMEKEQMINRYRKAWADFKQVCAGEAAMLAQANDLIIQVNQLVAEYKDSYETARVELEAAVQAMYQALPDANTGLGQQVQAELSARALGHIHYWEQALDEASFEFYEPEVLDLLGPRAPDNQMLRHTRLNASHLEEVLAIIERLKPGSEKPEPFTPIQTSEPERHVGESMVTLPESHVRMMVQLLNEYLPKR